MAWIGVVTDVGRSMLNYYAQGGHTLDLVGATVGSGTVVEANLRVQTSLTGEKDDASIISADEIEGGVKYKIQVGPASADVGAYTAHQIGLWATLDSGPRTLLMLAQDADAGVSVPLKSGTPAFAFAIFMALSVDNTNSLTVEIDESAYVSAGIFNAAISKKLDKTSVYNGLDQTAEGYVLDARQAKILFDVLEALGSPVNLQHGGTGASNAANARSNLGVYSKSEVDAALEALGNLTIQINRGGTGATSAAKAKANLGFGTETENFGVSNSSGSQALVLSATVDNSANSALNGHRVLLVIHNKGITLFDSSAQSAVWNISLPLGTDNGGTGAETVADARTKLSVYSKSEVNSAIQSSYGLHGTTRVFDRQLSCPASYGYIQSSAFDLAKDGLYRFEAFWNAAAPKELYIRKGATTAESQCVAYGVKADNNSSIIVYCYLTAGQYYLYGAYQSASTNQFICDLFY